MKRKAFTLVEIMLAVAISFVILAVLYKVFFGTFGSFMKSANKITNLRAASIILSRLKNDVRCAVIPTSDDLKPILENNKFAFHTTSMNKGNEPSEKSKLVTYTWSGTELKREVEGMQARNINTALVKSFSVTPSEDGQKRRFITVKVVVDNEQNKDRRSDNSKANEIELSTVMYPRFFTESLTEDEKLWFATDR